MNGQFKYPFLCQSQLQLKQFERSVGKMSISFDPSEWLRLKFQTPITLIEGNGRFVAIATHNSYAVRRRSLEPSLPPHRPSLAACRSLTPGKRFQSTTLGGGNIRPTPYILY
jgi:hypothetical protein